MKIVKSKFNEDRAFAGFVGGLVFAVASGTGFIAGGLACMFAVWGFGLFCAAVALTCAFYSVDHDD